MGYVKTIRAHPELVKYLRNFLKFDNKFLKRKRIISETTTEYDSPRLYTHLQPKLLLQIYPFISNVYADCM